MNKQFVSILSVALLLFSFTIVESSPPGSCEKREERSNNDFTHTVFAEFATSLGCQYCKYAHAALKNIYAGGGAPFLYVSLITWNTHAAERLEEYNCQGYPKVYFDGGYKIVSGANNVPSAEEKYNENISECGEREVPEIDVNLSVEWHGNALMSIEVIVENHEETTYEGRIRVYVTEIASTMGWYDSWGFPYTFAFLDYAFNQDISISPLDTWCRTTLWDGYEHDDGHFNDFSGITHDNIMVIASVFNDEWHQGYSNPPDGNPFDAYYVDEAAAVIPFINSTPPDPPTISGPSTGKTGHEYDYRFNTTEYEGEDVYYWIDWGDGNCEEWIGPYPPNQEIIESHIWEEQGEYIIQAKAKDVVDAESNWSDPFQMYVSKSEVEIVRISGGIATIQADIKNNYPNDLIDVEWVISVDGGFLNLIHVQTEDSIPVFAHNQTQTILPDKPLVGFGNAFVNISVSVLDPYVDISEEATVFLFGPFVFIRGSDEIISKNEKLS